MKKIFAALLCVLVCEAGAQPSQSNVPAPNSHAPIGVMGDHLHKKGELMFSYRYMRMSMKDNRIETGDVSPETIVTTIANRFAGMPGMPPTLRVVPLSMTMNMHMLGAMYAPSDGVTFMAMGMFIQNDMSLLTFQGGSGTNELGTFATQTKGVGDVKLSALVKLAKIQSGTLHLQAGISLPTGSITEEDQVLTPMNMRPTVRSPYPMQLGSGSWDALPGITYASLSGNTGWGAQVSGVVRLVENREDYKLGNQLNMTFWASQRLASWVSASLRARYTTTGKIRGIDDDIMLPVQTANPDFMGGKNLDGALGINLIGQSGVVKNQRVALEYSLPVYQHLNGPQMKTTSVFTLGWQYAF